MAGFAHRFGVFAAGAEDRARECLGIRRPSATFPTVDYQEGGAGRRPTLSPTGATPRLSGLFSQYYPEQTSFQKCGTFAAGLIGRAARAGDASDAILVRG